MLCIYIYIQYLLGIEKIIEKRKKTRAGQRMGGPRGTRPPPRASADSTLRSATSSFPTESQLPKPQLARRPCVPCTHPDGTQPTTGARRTHACMPPACTPGKAWPPATALQGVVHRNAWDKSSQQGVWNCPAGFLWVVGGSVGGSQNFE